MKHFSQISDFSKDDILEVLRRAKIFDEGGDFTSLARGKILGLGFFQESTRTVSGFQSAIIRLGGGWLGLSSPVGSYVESGEESVEETLACLAEYSDVLAVRHKSFDLSAFARKSVVPVINGMCGGDEHSQGAVASVFTILQTRGDIENLKVGIYGMTKSSRPMKGVIRILSKFGAEFYEDSVVDDLATPENIRKEVEQAGCKITRLPFDEFVSMVDILVIAEGLPQQGEDKVLIDEYNKKVRIFGKNELSKLNNSASFYYCMPAVLTDGRSTVQKEDVDSDKRGIIYKTLHNFTTVNMAIITYILDIDV